MTGAGKNGEGKCDHGFDNYWNNRNNPLFYNKLHEKLKQ
jgi:hypothetical protein